MAWAETDGTPKTTQHKKETVASSRSNVGAQVLFEALLCRHNWTPNGAVHRG